MTKDELLSKQKYKRDAGVTLDEQGRRSDVSDRDREIYEKSRGRGNKDFLKKGKELGSDAREATSPKPLKAAGAVLSKGVKLGAKGYGAYTEALSVKQDIEYLKGGGNAGEDKGDRALGSSKSGLGLTSTGATLGQKGAEYGIKKLSSKILSGQGTKNITDVVKMGEKAGKFGKVAGAAGGALAVVGFGMDVKKEMDESSNLNTGRGFESDGDKAIRGTKLAASGAAAAAGTAAVVAAATGTAAANFWNPVGWVAAGVALVASGASWLSNRSKIRSRGR